MKVILLRDVAKVGRKGQVCEVPAGHAANFLIPRKLAVPATSENMKRHAADTARHTQDEERAKEAFESVLAALAGKTIAYLAPANDHGSLFKGIHAADIAQRLKDEGFVIDARSIILPQPIKEIGTHTIPLKQGAQEGELTLEVVKN
jgi:large subunit ribosomal protein L9